MDWILAPIDATRVHEVGFSVSWHARAMVLAWGILAPLAVFAARYFKIMPGQDWPRELDNQFWWRSHWMGHVSVVLLSLLGLGMVMGQGTATLHGQMGYGLLSLMVVQVALGVFRGSKGGPTALAHDGTPRGDHFDMTTWRVVFEHLHKSLGYLALALAALVIMLGLWDANAPRWMWIMLPGFWVVLIAASVRLQAHGHAVDTYQAIWGPDPKLPGNKRRPIGWGIRRFVEGGADVRRD